MSKQQTTNKDAIEDATILEEQSFTSDTANAPRNKAAILAVVLATIALLLAASTAWMQWQQQKMFQKLSYDSKAVSQTLFVLNNRLEKAEEARAQNQKNQQQVATLSRKKITTINQQVDSNSRRLMLVANTTSDDWQMAEVEYLLRLASQRLLIAKDDRTALNLLASADTIIVSLADPSWFDLRTAIAADRLAIASVDNIDVDGLFLRLAAISANIESLPLLRDRLQRRAVNVIEEPLEPNDLPPVLASLQQIVWQTWQELKTLVVVHSNAEPVKPLLPPEQRYYLRSNLRLLINQAQLALIDSRQPSYHQSLTQAVQWLNDYFQTDAASIETILIELDQLVKIDISQPLPGLEQSLMALKTAKKNRQLAVSLATESQLGQTESRRKDQEKKPTAIKPQVIIGEQ